MVWDHRAERAGSNRVRHTRDPETVTADNREGSQGTVSVDWDEGTHGNHKAARLEPLPTKRSLPGMGPVFRIVKEEMDGNCLYPKTQQQRSDPP